MNARLLSFCICGPGTVMSPFSLPFFGHATQCVGSWFPNQGSNSCSVRWKHGVFTTGRQGSPRDFYGSLSRFATVLVGCLAGCSTCLLQSTVLSAPALCLSDRLVGFRHGWVRRGMVDAPTELRAWWYQWWVMG